MDSKDAWAGDPRPYLGPGRKGTGDPWAAHAAAHGRKGTQRLLAVGAVDPPEPVREFFRLSHSAQVIARRRLILLDDRPIELADSYYPLHLANGTALAEHRKVRGGTASLLAAIGQTPEDEPLEDVAAAAATAEQSHLLRLPEGSPVLICVRFVASSTGEPIEVSIMTGTGHLRYRQRRQAS